MFSSDPCILSQNAFFLLGLVTDESQKNPFHSKRNHTMMIVKMDLKQRK